MQAQHVCQSAATAGVQLFWGFVCLFVVKWIQTTVMDYLYNHIQNRLKGALQSPFKTADGITMPVLVLYCSHSPVTPFHMLCKV